MKVYVITKGRYSDYHICAVTTDPDTAERLARIYSDRYDEAQVEEYDTDASQPLADGRIPHDVWFYRNGDIAVRPNAEAEDIERYEMNVVREFPEAYSYSELVYVLAPNEEKAKKIAIDRRTQYQAENAGI
jgi:hypothetical protein